MKLEEFHQPSYGRVYNCEYSQIIVCYNNWTIIIFHNGTYEKEYKHINQTILDGNLMNTYLIIMEGKYYDINADDSTCHGYYIIKFSSYPYNLQADLSIDGQVISSGENICEGTYFFPININYHDYYL